MQHVPSWRLSTGFQSADNYQAKPVPEGSSSFIVVPFAEKRKQVVSCQNAGSVIDQL